MVGLINYIMNKYIHFIYVFLVIFMTSCYEDFENDFHTTYSYFASQKPLRTLVDGEVQSIKVGVAFGGNREVNPSDWAKFSIEPSLLSDFPDLKILPDEYYELSDNETMTINNPNLAIADVTVSFKDDFFNLDDAYSRTYAIPFKLTDHSKDEIGKDANGNLKDYSLVVVKCVNKYHGNYFHRITITNDKTGEEVLKSDNNDLSANDVVSLSSINRNTIEYVNAKADEGLKIRIAIEEDGTVDISKSGSVDIIEPVAVFVPDAESLEFVGKQPKFKLTYKYIKDGITYKVDEELIRRQNPENDLRFEEW